MENQPLTDVEIGITSLVPGATETTINCWKPGSDLNGPPDFTKTVSTGELLIPGLIPQLLTCKIDIDP